MIYKFIYRYMKNVSKQSPRVWQVYLFCRYNILILETVTSDFQ